MNTATADLTDILAFSTDYPWAANRHGIPEIVLPDDQHTIRVWEDDNTYRLVVLSGGRAQLIHTEVSFSGVAAQAALLATIDAMVEELS